MGRILVVVLGLGGILYAAYTYVNGNHRGRSDADVSAPRHSLENVRGAADRIEQDAQRRADELLERTSD